MNGTNRRNASVRSAATTQPTTIRQILTTPTGKKNIVAIPITAGLMPYIPAFRTEPSNFKIRAVALPIADPTIAPRAISGELMAIPMTKRKPDRAFS
jgi:hypothetical protein